MPDNFIDNNNPEINVDKIMEKIREEVARRRQHDPAQCPREGARGSGLGSSRSNVLTVRSFLSSAEREADVGTQLPPMERFPGLIRWIAILAGKVVLYLSSFITKKQRNFNWASIQALKAITDSLERLCDEHKGLCDERGRLRGGHEMLVNAISEMRSTLFLQQKSIAVFLEEARKSLPVPLSKDQIETIVKEEDHFLDAMYVSFEDQFRGTREDIKERQKVYLPYIEQAKAGTEDAPILDVGCGRGEWLELLKESGYSAKGIDLNRIMIQQCKDLGLDVVETEVIEYLRSQKANTFGVITGFHIIEHLPLKTLIALFDESMRVLRPGGMIIFETPNPENLIVGACNFYSDPSHRRPLPPDTIKFIVEHRGFISVEILRLHKVKEPQFTGQEFVDEVVQRFNMEMDYSIIAYKA